MLLLLFGLFCIAIAVKANLWQDEELIHWELKDFQQIGVTKSVAYFSGVLCIMLWTILTVYEMVLGVSL